MGTKEETKTLNVYLEKLKTDVSAVHTQLVAEGADITAERIKSRYLGKDGVIPTHTVREAIRDHDQRMEMLIGQDYAKDILRRFEVLKLYVTGFIEHSYKKEDLDVRRSTGPS